MQQFSKNFSNKFLEYSCNELQKETYVEELFNEYSEFPNFPRSNYFSKKKVSKEIIERISGRNCLGEFKRDYVSLDEVLLEFPYNLEEIPSELSGYLCRNSRRNSVSRTWPDFEVLEKKTNARILRKIP